MSHTSVIDHDETPNEFMLTEGESSSTLATLEQESPPVTLATAKSGPCCEKCAAPLGLGVVTICRKCGWYASLGVCVEVDPNWETATDEAGSAQPVPQTSHVMFWINLIPRWGWVIIASAFAVIIESVVARLVTPADSSLRTMWSLGQLVIGLIAVFCCHVFNFMSLATEDSDVNLLDLVLRPIRIWVRTFRGLPRRLWFVDTLVCGLVAAIMSPLVIGGIPYERFWDWGFVQPPKQNLMGAIMDRAKELESRNGADNLEDAVGDFAGKGDITGGEQGQTAPAAPRTKVDCVILGYQLDRDGRLSSLLLGTAYRTALVYAGRVSPEMGEAERSDLLGRLAAIRTQQPFISIPAENVVWVKPKFTCRVSCTEQRRDGTMSETKWDTLLGTMNAGGK
jgi:hypothetical protein